jgi:hypothetical protein
MTCLDEPTEELSGLDALFYDVTLTDESTGLPLTTGVVQVLLCTVDTVAPLHPSAAIVSLTHVAAGRWTGTHNPADLVIALAALPVGRVFDRVLAVDNYTNGRRLARCRKVAVKEN